MTAKRAFDLLCAVIGLLVLAPAGLAIALWIKLDSPGPVFFRQERVGLRGTLFGIYKFRTMYTTAVGGSQLTVGRDPRVTRSGRFLRASKLDELPQLINVVKGDMSLVGPRPEVPRYVAHYPEGVREMVLSVRPGITDHASIAYRDESAVLGRAADPERAYLEEVLPVKLKYYQQYVLERSMWTDLKLIFATLAAIVARGEER